MGQFIKILNADICLYLNFFRDVKQFKYLMIKKYKQSAIFHNAFLVFKKMLKSNRNTARHQQIVIVKVFIICNLELQ